jgi:hypothetical protein
MTKDKLTRLEQKRMEVVKEFESQIDYSFDNLRNNIDLDLINGNTHFILEKINNLKSSFKILSNNILNPLIEFVEQEPQYEFKILTDKFEDFFNRELYKFKIEVTDYISGLDDQDDNREEDFDIMCLQFRDYIRDYIKKESENKND